MKKYCYCLVFSVVLIAMMLFGFTMTEISPDKIYPLEFSLEQDGYKAVISIHESEDGAYYVFLPSYADMASVKMVISSDSNVSLGETAVANGMGCDEFELETAYPVTVDGQDIAQLYFYKSANVATLYIDTITGSIERVHRDKEYSEQASVMLYTADGAKDVLDSKAYIKGRGNATWFNYGKRPYSLTLSSAADVLGMGAATKWNLLANAADPTNLNNKLILDLARQTGQVWAPGNAFVDVYMNGEYIGLYLLTEKVEVGPSRVDIDPQSGDFLCKVDLESRWLRLDNPMKTQSGRTVEITSPDSLTDLSRTNIMNAISQMEEIIMSGSDLSEAENFDLDSWVCRYLLDEISANIDSDLVSSYFYYSNGVFYGGPVWDYDMAFGKESRNISPTAFVAKNTYKSDAFISLYYPALYANESFYNRMVACYQSEFLPLLDQLLESGISDLAAEIQEAAKMNYLCCYGTLPNENDNIVRTTDELIAYLRARVSFLNSAWIEGVEYCTVQFESADGSGFWNFSVRKGTQFSTDLIDLEDTVWFDKSTGSTVDFEQPIMSDMILSYRRISEPVSESQQHSFMDRDFLNRCVVILSAGLLLIFLVGFVYIDVQQRRKERRAARETKRTHVSP